MQTCTQIMRTSLEVAMRCGTDSVDDDNDAPRAPIVRVCVCMFESRLANGRGEIVSSSVVGLCRPAWDDAQRT